MLVSRQLVKKISQAPFIAMCGAQGTGKSTLAEALIPELNKLFGNTTLIQGIARQLKAQKGISVDKDASVESKLMIESAYMDLEKDLKKVPKLFCRSIVDRYAYARAKPLDMDVYYNKMVPAYMFEYDVLIYVPIEEQVPLAADGFRNTDPEFQQTVDKEIRKIIREYTIPVQVVTGTVEERKTTALTAIKLRFGM